MLERLVGTSGIGARRWRVGVGLNAVERFGAYGEVPLVRKECG